MAAGDLLALRLRQHFGSSTKDLYNIWHYRQTAGTGGAHELRVAFNAAVSPGIQAIQSAGIIWQDYFTENLDNPGDFETDGGVLGTAGSRAGDALPAYNNWKFQYVRSTRTNRHGWKRIPGVAESDQNVGIPTSGITTLANALAVAMGTTLTDLAGNAWSPRIYRAPGTRWYLKAHTAVSRVYVRGDFPVSSVIFAGMSTQNTRK